MNKDTSNKTWWKICKSEMGISNKSLVPPLISNDEIVTDDQIKCEVLNEYFAAQCTKTVPKSSVDFLLNERLKLRSDSLPVFNELIVCEADIIQVTNNININKSGGTDSISNVVLKRCGEQLSVPLCILFNKSLSDAYFPQSWKKADIYPVHKKGDRSLCSNYRPISLLSPTSKVFERLVYNNLYVFCKNNNFLTPCNSGFKKCDSTVNQLVHLTHAIYNGLDNGDKIAAVFLDVAKAFDSVWHEGLLFKLERMGIRGKLLNWFRSYLSGRSQRVLLNGKLSKFLCIYFGVPQGSILGPLLFLIFLNDIVDDIESKIFLFADDTSLLNLSESWDTVQAKLNSDLLKLHKWSETWLISFNAIKTEYMLFSTKSILIDPIRLQLNGVILKRTEVHKHLGLVFNSSLTWSDHINNVCLRVSKRLGILYKFKYLLDRNILLNLYCTWIRPVIEYCSSCYANLSVADSIRLEKLQRRAVLICTGAMPRTETDKLLAEVGLPHLHERRRNAQIMLLYKILFKFTPYYLYNDLLDLGVLTSRSISRLCIPKCKSTKFKNSFFPLTVKYWNSLPNEIKSNSTSVLHFKSKISIAIGPSSTNFKVFNKFSGFYGSTLSQMRLGLSYLRGDLFAFHLTENPMCPLCLDAYESSIHYICECPVLQDPRALLKSSLATLIPAISDLNNKNLTKLCLFGSNNVSFEVNVSILKFTIAFVKSSNRFSRNFMTHTEH